jgi:hypothetical protein
MINITLLGKRIMDSEIISIEVEYYVDISLGGFLLVKKAR